MTLNPIDAFMKILEFFSKMPTIIQHVFYVFVFGEDESSPLGVKHEKLIDVLNNRQLTQLDWFVTLCWQFIGHFYKGESTTEQSDKLYTLYELMDEKLRPELSEPPKGEY